MKGRTGIGSRPAADATASQGVSGVAGVGALAVGVACVALAMASGGFDAGEGAVGRGPTAAFLALALGAPVAAGVAWWAVPRGAFSSWPVRVGLGAAAGLVAWSALSVAWAAAPDLAWIDANRAALALCALVVGVVLARRVSQPGAVASLGLSAIALPVAVWGLASKITPTLVGPDKAIARLSEPMGYWNAAALLVVLALPGAMWFSARPGAGPVQRAAGAAAVTLFVVTLLLTYSRAGIVVALVVAGACVALVPRGLRLLVPLSAGIAGAVLPLAHALTTGALTTDGLSAADRRDAGIALGWRLAVGLAVAVGLMLLAVRLAPRLRPHSQALRRAGLIALVAAGVALVVVGGLKFDSIANRVGGDAVDNNPNRITDPSLNGRIDWAAEALRGFADAPLAGQGAGGFRLIHLAERETVLNAGERIRHPHQLATQMAGELGIVGLVLLLTLVGAIAWAAVHARRRGADSTIGLAIAIAAGFMLHVQVDFTWSIPGVAVPALIVCGVVLAGGASEVGGGRAPKWWAAPALAVFAMTAVASAFLPWQAGRSLEAGYADRPFAHAATARSLNPLWIEPDLFEAAVAADTDPDRALRAARRATDKQPDNPRTWRALLAAGATAADAETARRRIGELDPLGSPP